MAGEEDEGRDGRRRAHGTRGKTTQQLAKTATGRVRLHICPLCLHRKRAQYRKQMPGCPILIPAPARVPRVRPGLSLVFMLGGVHFSIGVAADPSILILFSVSHAVSQRPRKCKQHKHKHGQIQQRKVKEIRWWKPCTIKCKVMSNRVFRPEGP